MSFRSLARDIRDSIGSLLRRSFEVRLRSHDHGKSHGAFHELHESSVVQNSCWASLPPELLHDIIKRLEENEETWHVVACSGVCRSWREMSKEIFQNPELCKRLTFPFSLKQPGSRDGTIQCFIKRNNSKMTYHLFLCLSPALLVENGRFLLSAKRNRKTTCTEYVISMDADNISRSSSSYIWKIEPPYNSSDTSHSGNTIRRFYPKKVSPKVPTGSHSIAQVMYELNVLGSRGPRKMHCIMHSIPTSSLEPSGTVLGQPELLSLPVEDSFSPSRVVKSS